MEVGLSVGSLIAEPRFAIENDLPHMLRKKICMLGSFAVGKTSLVRRFVEGLFSDKYLTTLGVKISKKEVAVEDREVSLVVWDLHGDDEFQKVQPSYLRGSSGYLLIADGTRPQTIDKAIELRQLANDTLGEDTPFLCLLNKSDLVDEWAVEDEQVQRLRDSGWTIHRTSAKTGDHVDEAFEELARRMI